MAFHLQQSVNGWTEAIERLPDKSIIKAVDRGDLLRTVKQINPHIKTALRHWYDGDQHFGGSVEDNRNRARQFFSTFIDGTFREQYAAHVNIVVEFNEYLASSHTGAELDDRLRWAEAVAWVWSNEYRSQPDYEHIRLALLSVPVGNDIDVRFAEIAAEYDCIVSYHAYDHYMSGERDPGSWRWHCGRWHYMEQEWPAHLRPTWMFGEAGPYASVTGGWRDSKVLGGDREAYVEAVRRWVREIKGTAAYAEGRVLGFNLFTTARAGGVFDLYRTNQPEMNMLAEMLAEEWQPGNDPPPPPPPEPEPRTWDKYVILLPQTTGREQYADVADVAYPTRTEIAFSADSAFARPPSVTSHRVAVYAVEEWGGVEALEAWVSEHYGLPDRIEYRDWPQSSGSSGQVQSSHGQTGFHFAVWPTVEERITQRYGANKSYYAQFGLPGGHEGLDIAAAPGTPLYAVYPGTVYRATGNEGNYGIQVRIEHAGGYKTVYAHLQELRCAVGDVVEAGDVIGLADSTGNSTGSHLHMTVKKDGRIIDPTEFVEEYEPVWP